MKGSIIQRNGSYRLQISLGKDPVTGKYKQHCETVKGGSKKDAQRRLRELLSSIDVGMFVKPTKTTLEEYLKQWLKDYCSSNLTPRTTEGYQSIIRCHLIPSLGNIRLTELKPEHIQHLYSEKITAGLSHRTIRYIHVTLHKALHNAVKLGLIVRNPTDAVEPPKIQRHEMFTMNESDMHIFLEYAKSTPYYALFYLALFTGMRRSELLGLKWTEVDLFLCQLSVTRALHQLQDGSLIFKEPKTVKGRRLISLTPSTVIMLREYSEQQEKIRQSLGVTPTDDDLVFSHFDGKPLLPNTVSHAWEKLV